MNKAIKLSLQIAFLALVVYGLAAVFGAAEGFSVRGKDVRFAIGKRAQRKHAPHAAVMVSDSYRYANTGMVSTLMATAGTDVPRVGINSQIP